MFSKNTKYPKAQFYRKILDLGICSQFASKKTKRATKKDTKKLLDKKLDCKAIAVLKL